MISGVLFPSFSALLLDGFHPFIAGLNVAIVPFALSYTGIALRRNHRVNRPVPLTWIGQHSMDFPPIIGAITIAPCYGLRNLAQQRLDLPTA